jgi:hypothetical protein
MGLYEDWLSGSSARLPFAKALANTEFVFDAMEWAFPNASVAYATTAGSAATATNAGHASSADNSTTAGYALSVQHLSNHIGILDYGNLGTQNLIIDASSLKPITLFRAKWTGVSDHDITVTINGQHEPLCSIGAIWDQEGTQGFDTRVLWSSHGEQVLYNFGKNVNASNSAAAVNLMIFKSPWS